MMMASLSVPQACGGAAHHRALALSSKAATVRLAGRPSACRRKQRRSSGRWVPQANRVGAGTPYMHPDDIPDAALPSEPVTAAVHEPTAEPGPPPSLFDRVKRFFSGDALDRKRLAALGLGAVASYGLVSNVTYGGGMAVAWITFVKQKGLSPLQPGQWPAFLAFYAGFWTVQNFVRPLRFALAVSMAPLFDKFMNIMPMSKKKAFAVYLVLLGTITSVCVFGSIAVFAGPQAFSRAAIGV